MFRSYIVSALLATGIFGYAQYRGWSLSGSDAEEYQRMRSEQAAYSYSRSTGSSRSGSYSSHK